MARSPKQQTTRNRSAVDGPCSLVWMIAFDMHSVDPQVRRTDVVGECERQGVNPFTARRQYQEWFQAARQDGKAKAKK